VTGARDRRGCETRPFGAASAAFASGGDLSPAAPCGPIRPSARVRGNRSSGQVGCGEPANRINLRYLFNDAVHSVHRRPTQQQPFASLTGDTFDGHFAGAFSKKRIKQRSRRRFGNRQRRRVRRSPATEHALRRREAFFAHFLWPFGQKVWRLTGRVPSVLGVN
jgi:hypothetical protein